MHKDLLELLRSLLSHSVEFMVVGSTALAAHGRARYTEDLDLWTRNTEANVARLVAALKEFGFPVELESLRSFWENERQMITIGARPQAVDFLNFLGPDTFEAAWSRHIEASFGGVTVPVIGLEDFKRAKLAANRPKDLLDLALLDELQKNP